MVRHQSRQCKGTKADGTPCRAAVLEELLEFPAVSHRGLDVNPWRLRLNGHLAGKFLALLHQLPQSAIRPTGTLTR